MVSNWRNPALQPSGESDLLHGVQADAVLQEGLGNSGEAKAERGQQRAHLAPETGSRRRWLDRASTQASEVGADGSGASEESPAQRLCHGVAWRLGAHCSQRGQEWLAFGVAGQERPDDRGTVLATWDAEVWQQRHGPAGVHAQQPPNRNPCRASVLDQHASVVVAEQAKAVLRLAEGAFPGSLVDENVRRRQVGIEPASNRK